MPNPIEEPYVSAGAGWTALRKTAYTMLALMVLGAAWVRFNAQIAGTLPALAGPAAAVADQLADAGHIKGLIEVPFLPASAFPQALATMELPSAEARLLTEALERRRLRLVRMPLVDLSATNADHARLVHVSAGGYTRTVQLTRLPITVILPIGPVGSVSFQNLGSDGVGIGAVTLSGLARLPALPAGAAMDVGIVAQ